MVPRTQLGPRSAWLALLALVMLSTACGGYSARFAEVRSEVYAGDIVGAVGAVDPLIARAEAGERPYESDYPLLLLERGSLMQAQGMHREAVDDFTAADPLLEVLDLSSDGVGNAATYLWSESRSLYRPPVYEKLMVNVSALASFLALGDFAGARVEARRIGVLTEYFEGTELATHPMVGAANYMAGLAMELGGDDAAAVRFYIDAWHAARPPDLAEAMARLAWGTTLANRPEVAEAREAIGLSSGQAPPAAPAQEVVTIVFSGLAPYREPQHFPVGAIIAWIRLDNAYALSSEQEARLGRAVAEDLLTWVNFPVLVDHENQLERFDVTAGGARTTAEPIANIESFAISQWESDRPGIAFAAIVRALVRIAARETINAVGNAADNGNGVGQAIGFIAGLATQGAMQAADVPDTRTWTMMPAYVSVARMPAEAGASEVRVTGYGLGASEQRVVQVQVPAGGAAVVTVRFLR